MPLNDDFVCVINSRENRVARLNRGDLGAWHFSYAQTRMKLGSKKQEVLLDAAALLGPLVTAEERCSNFGRPLRILPSNSRGSTNVTKTAHLPFLSRWTVACF
jgi:hypothetical protein